MKVVILKYNAGNVQSASYALQRLGIEPVISSDKKEILSADKLIIPGVGEASSAMKYLRENQLDVLIKGLKRPVLGICLGMQLMCSYSEEGNTNCLGVFEQVVKRFDPVPNLKVPHMGWNCLSELRSPLLTGVSERDYVYFVHSYFVEIGIDTIATCNYSNDFSAGLKKNNFYGVQFHPEKSSGVGEKILKNFIEL